MSEKQCFSKKRVLVSLSFDHAHANLLMRTYNRERSRPVLFLKDFIPMVI